MSAISLDGRRVIALAEPASPILGMLPSLAERGARIRVVSSSPDVAADAKFAPSDPGTLERAVTELRRDLGGLDAAVVAASEHRIGRFLATPAGDLQALVESNLVAPFLFLQLVVKAIQEDSKPGRLVAICDATAVRGISGAAAWSSSQAALRALLQALSQELAPSGITSNCVIRGWFEDTPGRGPEALQENQLLRFIPMKRFGTSDELGGLVAYLLSEASGFVNGASIAVDGGVLKHL